MSPSASNRNGGLVSRSWRAGVHLVVGSLAFVTAAGTPGEPAESRQAVLERATGVVVRLRDSLGEIAGTSNSDFDGRYEKIFTTVTETHDFRYMVGFLLRRTWKDLSAEQQTLFHDRFTRLSVGQYASRFARLDRAAMEVAGAEWHSPTRVYVQASLTPPDGDVVSLSYTLGFRDGTWRITNVVANGVSDLALRRAEYSRVFSERGFAALIEHVEAQIAELD